MTAVETLPNGLVVILEEDRSAPRVAVHVLVRAGAAEDPPGRSGLAHLVEHLVFTGSADAPDGAYDRLLAAAGGESNAWTDHDRTAFWAVVPKGSEARLLALEADALGAPAWPAGALENQARVVGQERADERLPGGLDAAWLSELLWPEGHPYRRRVMGDPAELAAATVEDARGFVAAHYTAGAIRVAVVGDFDVDAMRARVREAFAAIPEGEGALRAADPPGPLDHPVHAWRHADVDRPAVHLGWRGPARDDPDRVALTALADLVEDTPVPDGARLGVRAWSGEFGGSFVVDLRAGHGLGRAVRAVERTIARLAEAGPSAAEVARVRARERAGLLRGIEATEDHAQALNLCFDATGRPDCLDGELAAWDALTPDAIAGAARRWLRPEARATLTVVPPGRPAPGFAR